MELIAWFVGVTLGFPLAAGWFGWIVLGRVWALDRAERFAAAWGVAFAFLGASRLITFAARQSSLPSGLTTLAVALALAALLRKRGVSDSTKLGGSVWPLAGWFGLGYLHLVLVSALLPVFRGSDWHFDWAMHFSEARVFLGDEPFDRRWAFGYTLASRMPLYNSTCAAVMSFAGHDFATFQLASALVSWTFVLPLYLLVRDRFGTRIAMLVLLLAPLNLWALHNAWFTWPKMMTAYFLFLSLHFYLRSLRIRVAKPPAATQLFVASGVLAVLSYMTHQVAAVYVAPLVIHAAYKGIRDRRYLPRAIELMTLILASVLLLAPWYIWVSTNLGSDKILGTSPLLLGSTTSPLGEGRFLTSIASNTSYSLIPWQFVRLAVEGRTNFAGFYDAVTTLYFSLFIGALTLSLTGYLLLLARRRPWRSRSKAPGEAGIAAEPGEGAVLGCFALLGYLGAAIVHPWHTLHGIAHSTAFPTTLLASALAWGVLGRAHRRTGLIVVSGMIGEFLVMFWSHLYLLAHYPEALEKLPGNAQYKAEAGIQFFNDLLGNSQYLFVVATAMVQALLSFRIAQWWRTQPDRNAQQKVAVS